MKRLKYEYFAIRDTVRGLKELYKATKSIKKVLGLLVLYGEYNTLDGKVKRGTYYHYSRDFWFENKRD